MHQKKSEVQIGKESSGVSSDFNPTPPLHFPSPSLHPQQLPYFQSGSCSALTSSSFSSSFQSPPLSSDNHSSPEVQNDSFASPLPLSTTPKTTPHKRLIFTQTTATNPSSSDSKPLLKSPTLSNSLHQYPFSSTSLSKNRYPISKNQYTSMKNHNIRLKKKIFFRLQKPFHLARFVRIHLRLVLLLCVPFFYFLVSHPTHSFILDFLSAFAFSAALLFSLSVGLPRLPSIRLFLSKTFPIKLSPLRRGSRPPLPVFWSIGSRLKPDKRLNSGCWVQAYRNGDVYEGEFYQGKCSGTGVYYYYLSGRYEGDWVDGKYDGYGVETWARGSRYRGQYKQGLRNGFGVYRFYTGDVYAGEWLNGQSHGCGVHTCEDGSRYVGEFKWGVKHGFGHYHFRNGDTYAGEYFADKMHGYGVYRFANGHYYEGAWHEGKRQGLGMYTFRNGETHSGHWQNGILDVPSTQHSTYPLAPVAVYHSKVLNAVQEARRAAKKAYDLGKVDERVNKAVAASNRAANAARVSSVKAVQKQMHHSSNSNEIPFHIV